MSPTWRALGRRVTEELRAAGVEAPEVDARRIVEAASGREGAEYHTVREEPAPERGVAALDAMAARRREGEPLQYVTGRWGFRSLDLFVDRRVLIPRPETEVVAGLAMSELDRRGGERVTVVDLGTGSGAIALAIAVERPRAEVWATDRSPEALAVARANIAGTGRAGARVHLVEGSWYEALPGPLAGAIEVVVSNPPYVAERDELPTVVADWEPTDALVAGPEGTEALAVVLAGAARWLAPGGSVVVELAPVQVDRAVELASAAGLGEIAVHPDLAGRDRALVARRVP